MPAKKSLVQQTADKIYKIIVEEKQFMPNEQLPNENELSEKLGISRTTLREAIRILALQGVVTVQRGKGTYVSSKIPEIGTNLESVKRHNLHLRDLLEARLIFEPEIVKLACIRASDEEIENIVYFANKVEGNILSNIDNTENDQKFHNAIIEASHNEFFQKLLPIISNGVQEAISQGTKDLYYGCESVLMQNTLRDHANIVEFLLKRDGDGAKNAMAIHIRHIIDNIELDLDNI